MRIKNGRPPDAYFETAGRLDAFLQRFAWPVLDEEKLS
jgi:hypothetical protein